MKLLVRTLLFSLFCVCILNLNAQELPPIQNFLPEHYHGETQNWSLTQDNQNTIISANNKGLLTYDGEQWKLINSPNQSIIRSVKVIDDRIYGGMYMNFGFWTKNEIGNLEYTSLSDKLNVPIIEDEQFWKIISMQNWILFQSLNRIYIYNTQDNSYKIINSESGIFRMYKVNNDIYFQKTNQGLFKIEEGKDKLINNSSILINDRIINVFKLEDKLLVQTENSGFFALKDNTLNPWNKELNTILNTKSIYNSIQLSNGNFALGTISNGVIIVNNIGELIYNLDQSKGLANNTVLSLFEDSKKNLWLGLDNGISCINMDTTIMVYNDDNGLIGSIYTSNVYNDNLFIGTNQGLYYKPLNTQDNLKLVEGTQGQVWNLFKYDNKLFCGHDSGTFVIEDTIATKITNIQGAWNIKPIKDRPNLLIQGNYDGLYVLQKTNNSWSLKHKINGYEISSKYFEFINDTEILISHEYKGIIHLTLNSDLTEITQITTKEHLKGLKSSLLKHNNTIYYAYNNGVFEYNKTEKKFSKNDTLSIVFNNDAFTTGKLISDSQNNRLWIFSKDYLYYSEPGNLSRTPKLSSIPLPYELIKSVSGYDNILALDNNKYLIGTTSGYISIDLKKINNRSFETRITSITNTNERTTQALNNVSLNTDGSFKNNQNNLEFTYSINQFDKYFITEYQYQLEGIYNNWSDWSTESEQNFENLPYGNYTFNVRGRINNKVSDNIASYKFVIERPWYISNTLIIIYIISFILLSLFIHNIYRLYYKKQKQKILESSKRELALQELENQKQIMRIQNETLAKDIENKNRELAISTMSLIKKNEFLGTIKKELKDINNKDLNKVLRIIDNNINNTDDWQLFEEAFNNADKDFLKKVKAKHNSLTPNDLRLCAYLRLNLSSKEIAPLLNISPRSVEVKRYRLRKKMNLPHEASLTNYLIEF